MWFLAPMQELHDRAVKGNAKAVRSTVVAKGPEGRKAVPSGGLESGTGFRTLTRPGCGRLPFGVPTGGNKLK